MAVKAKSNPQKAASKSTASKSPKAKRKRVKRQMDTKIVDSYISRLERTLGDEGAFPTVFNEMKADSRVGQPEAVGILSRFLGPAAKSTTKTRAFERIWARHANLRAHISKERVTSSRSAA